MIEDGIPSNIDSPIKKWPMLNSCIPLIFESILAEMYLQKMLDKKIAVDAMAVSTVIDSHARNGDVESASKVLTKMLDMKVKPSIAMFNAMIHSCAMYEDENRFCTGDKFEATHWLNRARELNLTPDAYTYTNLLHLAAQNHDADAACDYFVQMVQNKFTPSIECANAVVDVYTKILQPRRGISFFNKFQEFDVLADKISFKIVFAACRDACMQQNPVHNM